MVNSPNPSVPGGSEWIPVRRLAAIIVSRATWLDRGLPIFSPASHYIPDRLRRSVHRRTPAHISWQSPREAPGVVAAGHQGVLRFGGSIPAIVAASGAINAAGMHERYEPLAAKGLDPLVTRRVCWGVLTTPPFSSW